MAEFREDWGNVLLPIVTETYELHKKQHPDFKATLFDVQSSKKAVEIHDNVGELGLMDEWESTERRVSYDRVRRGFRAFYQHKKFSKGMAFERELWEDDQFGEIKKQTRKLARSVWYTTQYHAARVFNEAFTSNIIGPDGKGLCAADHPCGPESDYTFTNADSSLELSSSNLEKIRTRMMEWTDDRGNLLVLNPDTLLVPPALREAALVISGSEKKPDTDYNNVNIWYGNVKVIEYPFLRDPKAWFVIDSARMKDFLIWYDRRKANLEQDKEDFDTEVSRYKVVSRFSYGWDNASFIYGCKEPS